MIAQGDIWWADLGEPVGSAPRYSRPVLVIQSDALNRSGIGTVLSVPLTSNLKWADAIGNHRLKASTTGLDRDSVVNVSQITAVDKLQLRDFIGRVSPGDLQTVFAGIDKVLGR